MANVEEKGKAKIGIQTQVTINHEFLNHFAVADTQYAETII